MPGSVYHPFQRADLLSTVVHASPKLSFSSGTMGWRGSLGESGSLSLYSGLRGRKDVRRGSVLSSGIELFPLDPLDTHSIDKVIFISGSYPATGSIGYARVKKQPITPSLGSYFSLVNSENWYDEHFSPIELLFDHYSKINPQYFTGSYDYYCLRFKENVSGSAAGVLFSGSSGGNFSGSLTVEARVRPMSLSGTRGRVIVGQKDNFKLFFEKISGSLSFSDYITEFNSAFTVTVGKWSHVAVSYENSVVRFYIDGELVDSVSGSASILSSSLPYFVGSEYVSGSNFVSGSDGFIYETRVWEQKRTDDQIFDLSTSVVFDSGSAELLLYPRFNDGPLATAHGFLSGSGTFDYSPYSSPGRLYNFGTTLPATPIWHRNDDLGFVVPKKEAEGEPEVFRVVHMPSMFYGRQIATGSVRLECNAYANQGITRVLLDDGRGSLYLSGSFTRAVGGEENAGVRWNKVGNVFYSEGLVVITDPSMLDFGDINLDSGAITGTLNVDLRGVSRIPSKVFMCRLGMAEANASNNPTFSFLDDRGDDDPTNDRFLLVQDSPTTYISAVGIYNEERRLVAVAKLAQPIRKREKDKLNIKLKMDF